MTYKLSNLQVNALRIFTANQNRLSHEEFAKIDQRITSGLGRRGEPLVARIATDQYAITPEGLRAIQAMESTDVFRKFASLDVAKVFSHVTRRRVFPITGAEAYPKREPKRAGRSRSSKVGVA